MKKVVDYTEELALYWDTIMHAWSEHCDKRAVIECDLSVGRVAACPAIEYINGLSMRTRKATLREYDKAVREGGMMVFIRDSEREVLQSYSFILEAQQKQKMPNQRLQRTRKKPRASSPNR